MVRFSRVRKRYERQGVLVEESALEQAEAEDASVYANAYVISFAVLLDRDTMVDCLANLRLARQPKFGSSSARDKITAQTAPEVQERPGLTWHTSEAEQLFTQSLPLSNTQRTCAGTRSTDRQQIIGNRFRKVVPAGGRTRCPDRTVSVGIRLFSSEVLDELT